MGISQIKNNTVQDSHQSVIQIICEYAGWNFICKMGAPHPFLNYRANGADEQKLKKKVYSPAYFANFTLFVHLCVKWAKYVFRHYYTAYCGQIYILYRFGEIHISYRPINSRLGQIMFVGPRTLAHSILDDFRRLSKSLSPDEALSKCQLGNKHHITQTGKCLLR